MFIYGWMWDWKIRARIACKSFSKCQNAPSQGWKHPWNQSESQELQEIRRALIYNISLKWVQWWDFKWGRLGRLSWTQIWITTWRFPMVEDKRVHFEDRWMVGLRFELSTGISWLTSWVW